MVGPHRPKIREPLVKLIPILRKQLQRHEHLGIPDAALRLDALARNRDPNLLVIGKVLGEDIS